MTGAASGGAGSGVRLAAAFEKEVSELSQRLHVKHSHTLCFCQVADLLKQNEHQRRKLGNVNEELTASTARCRVQEETIVRLTEELNHEHQLVEDLLSKR